MGIAADEARRTIGIHRRRRPGRARDGRCCSIRFGIDAVIVEKSADHDRSSKVARLLGPHHGDLPAVGDRNGDPRPRPAGELRHVRVQVDSIAGHEFGRTRPEPNVGQTPAWKSLVAQDAVEEEICSVIEQSKQCHGAVLAPNS